MVSKAKCLKESSSLRKLDLGLANVNEMLLQALARTAIELNTTLDTLGLSSKVIRGIYAFEDEI